MKIGKQKIAKRIRLYAIGTWGILSILYIAGEPLDDQQVLLFEATWVRFAWAMYANRKEVEQSREVSRIE